MKSHPHFKTQKQARKFFMKDIYMKMKDSYSDPEAAFYEWLVDEEVIIDEHDDEIITGL